MLSSSVSSTTGSPNRMRSCSEPASACTTEPRVTHALPGSVHTTAMLVSMPVGRLRGDAQACAYVLDAINSPAGDFPQAAHRQAAVLHHVVVRRLVHEARQRREGAAGFGDGNQYISIVPDSTSSPGEVEVQRNGLQLTVNKNKMLIPDKQSQPQQACPACRAAAGVQVPSIAAGTKTPAQGARATGTTDKG